jgi:broad specificity phosphatase PhoE
MEAKDPSPTPRRPAVLALVRHAESQRNLLKRGNTFFVDDESRRDVRGVADPDVELTQEGRRQALETGRALRARFGGFDCVYHSGYRRTRETAELLLAAWTQEERRAVAVRHDLFIRERDAGYAFEMTTEEAERAFPWLSSYWRTAGTFFGQPPGGESLARVCERVHLFLDVLFRERAGQRVLVVSHAATLCAFRFLLERWTYEETTAHLHSEVSPNCGVTTYAFDPTPRRLVLQRLNEVLWSAPNLTV